MFKDWKEIVDGCVQTVTVVTKDKDGKEISTANDVATLNCVPAVFLNIVSALLVFAGLTALVMFILGGFKYMNSAGDPKKLEGARNTLIYGIIGLLIVLFSFLIINVISQVTNVPCITKFGFICPSPTPTP